MESQGTSRLGEGQACLFAVVLDSTESLVIDHAAFSKPAASHSRNERS